MGKSDGTKLVGSIVFVGSNVFEGSKEGSGDGDSVGEIDLVGDTDGNLDGRAEGVCAANTWI